jgi:hypothetical protein
MSKKSGKKKYAHWHQFHYREASSRNKKETIEDEKGISTNKVG